MFDIEYKGGNTVVIATKKVNIVFDPRRSLIGLKDITLKDGVQVATEERFALDEGLYRLSIEGPGEYEVADVSIHGVSAVRHIDDVAKTPDSTIYQLEIGGIRLAVIGNIGPRLSEEQMEAVGVVDIIVIPVGGGGYTLDATSAASLVRQLEPKAVIPVHYDEAGLSYEVPQDKLDVFTGELGAPIEQAGSKLKVKTASALPDVLTTVVIDRS